VLRRSLEHHRHHAHSHFKKTQKASNRRLGRSEAYILKCLLHGVSYALKIEISKEMDRD